MKKISVLLVMIVAIAISCKKKSTSTSTTSETKTEVKEDPCVGAEATYAATKVIFNAKCIKCHQGDNAAAGKDLTSFETARQIANNGELACVLKGESCKAMPPMGKLSDDDMKTILCWVKNGAKNN